MILFVGKISRKQKIPYTPGYGSARRASIYGKNLPQTKTLKITQVSNLK